MTVVGQTLHLGGRRPMLDFHPIADDMRTEPEQSHGASANLESRGACELCLVSIACSPKPDGAGEVRKSGEHHRRCAEFQTWATTEGGRSASLWKCLLYLGQRLSRFAAKQHRAAARSIRNYATVVNQG